MGNSLLDFVMSLMRDPEVAAHYAADPAGALAAAGLPEVTTADVSSLIPMVSDSLAMSSPGFSGVLAPAAPAADAANVWASGAATAAFDAFGIAPPAAPAAASPAVSSSDHVDPPPPADLGQAPAVPDPIVAEPMADQLSDPAPWTDHADVGAVVDPHPVSHHFDAHPGEPPAFDLF